MPGFFFQQPVDPASALTLNVLLKGTTWYSPGVSGGSRQVPHERKAPGWQPAEHTVAEVVMLITPPSTETAHVASGAAQPLKPKSTTSDTGWPAATSPGLHTD